MGLRKTKLTKLRSAFLALVILTSQLVAVMTPFLATQVAHAAPACIVDQQGTDDEPGQKDLTQMCVDPQASPVVSWQWDDTAWPGSNTGDACALFDTNNNGLVDYATCVTVGGNPAVQQSNSPRIYSCGDTKPETCTGPVLITGPYVTTCTVTTDGDDPFDATTDTKASCVIKPSEVGSGKLIDVCSYPSQQPNSDFSDCIVFRSNSAKLEVQKVLSPADDNGIFDLKINGTTYANDVSNGGTTGEIVVSKGSVTISEAENAPTDLAQYTTSVVCRNLNGTGTIVAQGTPSGNDSRQLTFTIAEESDVVCIFTNTRQTGSLTVVKNLVKDNGGTQSVTDFGFQVNGGSVIPFEADASNTITYPAGTVITSVTEPAVTGYATTYNNCTNLTIVAGQTQTCTITNNDVAPQLTVIKHVINDNGGKASASDFEMQVASANNGYNAFAGSEAGTTISINAGSFNVAESAGVGGYSASFSGECAGTIALGDSKTCTITNDDIAPNLTLNKIVVNAHGGKAVESDWTLTATGPTNLSGKGAAGSTDVVSGSGFKAGTYTLSESGVPTGYSASAWTCTNGVTVTNGQITLANGQTTVCSITNTDIAPGLTILKLVENPYGTPLPVSSFPLFVDETQVTSGVKNTQFDAGTHAVSETQQTGYTLTNVSGDCTQAEDLSISVLLSIGSDATCTLTNTAIQPKLIVIKHVVNDNGGTKEAEDFTMTVSGNSQSVANFAGDENGTTIGLNEGSYSVDELADSAYAKTLSEDCSGKIYAGETKTCTITNNDIQPKLTVTKVVINDNGGNKVVSDFPLFVDETKVTSGAQNGFNAGNYTVSETADSGYESSISGDCAGNGSVTLSAGDVKSCTITNNDIAPSLKLVKIVKNDNGGNKVVSDFLLAINGDTVISGEPNTLSANVLYTASETNLPGYSASGWTGDCASDGTITLAPGDHKTCTITNDDIAPRLTLYKNVINDNSGESTPSDWTLTATPDNEGQVLSGNGDDGFVSKDAESHVTYTLSESGPEGYTAGYWYCYSEGEGDFSYQNESSDQIKMNEGADLTCYITNNDIPHPAIKVVKSGPNTAKAGDTVTYTFTVTNAGDVVLNDITVVDSITGDGTYVSGDTNNNNRLDLDETWIYTGVYKIPADQKTSVKNTVTVCGYDSPQFSIANLERILSDEIEITDGRNQVCAQDKHILTIPQVLGETTLVNTGDGRTLMFTMIGAANIVLVAGALGLTRRQAKK